MTDYNKWNNFEYESSDEEDPLGKYKTQKADAIYLKPVPFSDQREFCERMELDNDFGAWMDENKQHPKFKEKYGWSYQSSQLVAGYTINDPKVFILYFDDNFLMTQVDKNLAGRTLLCSNCLGPCVVIAIDSATKQRAKISLYEVADMIIKRMDGDVQDRKRLQRARQHAADTKKQFEDEGVQLVDVSKGAEKATT